MSVVTEGDNMNKPNKSRRLTDAAPIYKSLIVAWLVIVAISYVTFFYFLGGELK